VTAFLFFSLTFFEIARMFVHLGDGVSLIVNANDGHHVIGCTGVGWITPCANFKSLMPSINRHFGRSESIECPCEGR
jgi:hypothetical protein